jgi:hypothetical protein
MPKITVPEVRNTGVVYLCAVVGVVTNNNLAGNAEPRWLRAELLVTTPTTAKQTR